jgi:hypothetical protein
LNPAISAEYILGLGKSVKDATSKSTCTDSRTQRQFDPFWGKILVTILATD